MTCKSACISCVRINHATIVNVVVYHTGRHKRSSEVKVHMLKWSVRGAICVQYPGNDLARILPCATAGILEGSRAMFCTPFGSPAFCMTTGTLLYSMPQQQGTPSAATDNVNTTSCHARYRRFRLAHCSYTRWLWSSRGFSYFLKSDSVRALWHTHVCNSVLSIIT